MTINNVIREAAANVIRWHKACETAQPRDWCLCVPLFGAKAVESLLYFAPLDVLVGIPEPSAWDRALFCPDCDKPRTPLYVHGLWPAGMRERLTGGAEWQTQELEVVSIPNTQLGMTLPTNGNGHHTNGFSKKPFRPSHDVSADDDQGDGNDWAL